MRGRRIGALATAAVLAFGIGACGGDDSTSSTSEGEAQTEAGAEAAFVDIISSTDPATCDRLTDNYLETLFPTESAEDARATCEEQITQGQEPKNLEVRTVTVDGDQASGDATSSFGYQRFKLVYVDGEWQLDFLEAGPEQPSGNSGGGGSGGNG